MSNLRNCSALIRKQSVSNVLCTMGASEINPGQKLSVRTFSQTKQLAKSKNFYEDLEIPRTATQSEIKSAYYELSMAYHPDKNKTDQAKVKFRLITEAYEVLGNVRTRRMYDKGIGTFASRSSSATDDSSNITESEIMYEPTEDDAVTKFYKQHMVKSRQPGVSAHNVDTYMSQTITKCFQERQKRRQEQREKLEDIKLHEQNSNGYLILFSICIAAIMYVHISQTMHTKQHNEQLRRIKLEKEKDSSQK